MSTSKSSDMMPYGITILIFGVLFLLRELGILAMIPYGNTLISVRVFFIIAAIVFLATQPKKYLAWVFLAIAIVLNANLVFGWLTTYSYLLMPAGLIIAGVAMILSAKK